MLPLVFNQKVQEIGHGACPSGATCLPIMGNVLAPVGQIYCQTSAQYVNVVTPILLFSGFCQRTQFLSLGFLSFDNSSHLTILFSSANHPDSCLTIARQPTIYLSEYYSEKPDNLTVFSEILVFTKNQAIWATFTYICQHKIIPPTGSL